MNFFELDISYFQRVNQLNFQEILFLGVFHGIVFSLPFSAPILICLRRFLLDGLKIGVLALFGTLFGELSFLLFIFLGIRPLIQCWYIFEPFLAFLGMSLALKLATDFFHQKNFGFEEGSFSRFSGAVENNSSAFSQFLTKIISAFDFLKIGKLFTGLFGITTLGKNSTVARQIFTFQFLLMFLNPSFPATSTRLILGQDLLDGISLMNWGVTTNSSLSGVQFGLLYSCGFIFGSFLLVSLLVFLFKVVFVQLENWGASLPLKLANTSASSNTISERSSRLKVLNSGNLFGNPIFLNKAFVFLIIGCLLQGTIQYSWRLFTQYPIDFIGWKSSTITEVGNSNAKRERSSAVISTPLFPSLQREFPSFDSNIRHREKNLQVERHVPVEKVNARRTLSGRPPLNEEQKSDAYLKYNSFFLNKIEQAVEDVKIQLRTPDSHIRTYEEILQPQKMKERYLKAQAFFSGYKNSIGIGTKATNDSQSPFSLISDLKITKARPLENTTKGKPKFSYIRELVDKRKDAKLSGASISSSNNNQDDFYIHDDIQIYNALFKLMN